jgi:hypothetical protein
LFASWVQIRVWIFLWDPCWDAHSSRVCIPRYVSSPGVHTLFIQNNAVTWHFRTKNRMWRQGRKKKSHNQIKVETGEEMRLQWLWVWQQMFYTNPTRCSQSVSMATESVIIESRHSPPHHPLSQQGGGWCIWTISNLSLALSLSSSSFCFAVFY